LEKLQLEIGARLDRLNLGKRGLGANGLSGFGFALAKPNDSEGARLHQKTNSFDELLFFKIFLQQARIYDVTR
jgi:hypothetical protein